VRGEILYPIFSGKKREVRSSEDERFGRHRSFGYYYLDLTGHFMSAEYIACDYAGLLRFGNIFDTAGEDGITVVGFAVFGDEAD
jgi:hypothetical protein